MNEITLALTRFWQNKQISLPPMSTLLIAAGIMFFCFWVVTSQKQKEQEERAKARKNVFQNMDAALQPHRFVNTFPVGQIRQSFIFWGYRRELFQSRKMLVFSVPI